MDSLDWEGLKYTSQQGGGEEEEDVDTEVLIARNENWLSFQEDTALVTLLKACAQLKDLHKGSRLHADILKRGLLKKNVFIGTTLVTMYAKCGALAKAQEVFDKLPVRDVVSWTALITGYAQHGHGGEALNLFEGMQREGLSPNAVTFVCILKACSSLRAAEKGTVIHAEIIRKGLMGKNSALGNALVDMYVKCGALAKAQQVFNGLPIQNVVSWTALISGYCQHGHGEEALNCFEQMQSEGLPPDSVTLLCVLQACSSTGAINKGKEIHAEIVREGLLGKDCVLGNALVDMYAKCGALVKSQEVFDELRVRSVVAWTALIAGYCQHGLGEEALDCFEQMQYEGLLPNAQTFSCILKICGSKGEAEKGKLIHAEIVKEGLLGEDNLLGTALVDMYGKCGALAEAQQVFDELLFQDKVSWTALIAGYCLHGHGKEAFKNLERMQSEGLSPDRVTWLCILQACGNIGAAEKGKEIHSEMVRQGLLGKGSVLGNALVDMYAKCGALAKAQEVFDELPAKSVVAWTALISGYAHVGKHDIVFEVYERMLGEGIEPNVVTFIVVLNACSYLGLVDEGQVYFKTMSTSYGIIPTPEHLTCMVDLFGRAGYFDKAMAMIKKIPPSDHPPAWFALLNACQIWGNVKLGKLAFEHAVRLDKNSAVAYACMSSIYAAAGMLEDASKIEAMRIESERWKMPGHWL